MSNSSLATYTFTNHKKYNPRKNTKYNPTGKVSKVTIHHMAGNLSMDTMKSLITQNGRQMSCNYAIDTSGRIGLFVDEDKRSWCSSSPENDYLAVTIEVANDEIGGQWHVSDAAMAALVELCADICRRNGIAKLDYTGDKTGNLTMHCWFAATACPGPYLKGQFPAIAAAVNERLGGSAPAANGPANTADPANPNDRADWDAPGNDFVVTASKGDRAALRSVCTQLALPVKNL